MGGTSPKAFAGPRSKDGSERHAVVRRMVEAELKACHATIARLKSEISNRRDALTAVEMKVPALKAMLDVYYQDFALPAPAPAAKVPTMADIAMSVRRIDDRAPVGTPPPAALVESTPPPDPDDDGLTPVPADFMVVKRWADARQIPFTSWADLHLVNRRRDRMGAPPFKQAATA